MRPRYADLFRRMTDPDPMLADAAFDAILFDRQDAVPDLIEGYVKYTRDAQTRYLIVQLLGFSGSAAAISVLLEALNDKDGVVRAEACRSLEDLSCSAAIPQLEARLADVDAEVRSAAQEALEALRSTG